MSIRVDSSSLISGAVVVGVPGLGVLAENLPTTGEHGGGIAATWLGPEDAGKEVRVFVTSWPAVGSLFVFEDTSFDYDGSGSTFEAQLYLDGVAIGTPQPVTIAIGEEAPPLAATAVSASTASGSLSTSIRMAGASASLSLADGDLSSAIRLQGRGLSASSATAVLSGASASLVGIGVTGSLAIGSLGTEIRLSGVGASRSEVWADLKSASVGLLGAAQSISAGLGELRTGIRLAVTARSQSAARAALVGGEPELPPPWRVLRLRYPSRILRLRP